MNKPTIEQLNAMFEQEDEKLLDDKKINYSSAAIERMADPVADAKRVEKWKATIATPEVQAKIKASRTGVKLSEEHKKKISIANTGNVYSEERNKQISEKLTGYVKPKEHMDKIKKALHKLPTPEEVVRYKQALEYGKRPARGMLTWGEAAKKFNVNYNRLKIYGEGKRLEELE